MNKIMVNGVIASVFVATSFSSALISSAWAGGILQRSIGAAPATLDPQKITTQWENAFTREMFEGLVVQNNDNTIVGALAEKWVVSDGGKTYTFTLRDAKWSDGQSITAHDVVYSYRRLFNPKTGVRNTGGMGIIANAGAVQQGKKPITDLGVKAIDSKTVQITLAVPRPFFLDILVGGMGYIVPKHAIEKHGNQWTRAENIVVGSAFKLSERLPNASISLTKNTNYWNGANVSLDGVKYHILQQPSTALLRYRAGDIHMTESIPGNQYAKVSQEFGKQLHIAPSTGLYFYVFNNQAITDLRVRKALSLAVNRDIIVDKVLKNGVRKTHKIVAPAVTNHNQTAILDYHALPMSKRLAQAKQLLQSAGYGKDKPFSIEISYNTSDDNKRIAVAIGSMWKQLGVNVTYANNEARAHFGKLAMGQYQVARVGFGGVPYDSSMMLGLFKTGSRFNHAKFSHPDFDKYFDGANREMDIKKRADLLGKAEQVALDNHAIIPIYHDVVPQLVSPKVTGYSANTLATQRSAHLGLK